MATVRGFYAAVEQQLRPSLVGKPFAVIHDGRVLDLSPELEVRGIGLGIRRANLLGLCPEATLVPHVAERYEGGRERLFDLYARHVPAVEPLDATDAFLDVAGLPALESVLWRIAREVRAELGVTVGFGLGPTKLAARAAGLELVRKGLSRPGEIRAVPPEPPAGKGLQSFLDPLPVAYLYPLPPDVLAWLARLGFGNVGEVRSLPERELARQFGWPVARRIAAAVAGGETDPVRPAWPPPSVKVSLPFEGGLTDRETLARALAGAAGRFARELGGQGLACGEVGLAFLGETGRREQLCRRLARPVRSAVALRQALEGLGDKLLETWRAGGAGGAGGTGDAGGAGGAAAEAPAGMEAWAGGVAPRAAEQLGFDHLRGFERAAPRPGGVGAPPPGGSGPSRLGGGGDEVREVAEELARRFAGRVAQGPGYGQKSRRESLLAFYDPLRAHVKAH